MDTREKIIDLDQAAEVAARLRAAGRPLIVAAGCFDVLQAGHARFLQRIHSDGSSGDNTLLVAVYDDAALCRLRGQARPILDQRARGQLVAALAAVDYVLIWNEASLDALAARLGPERVEHVPDERNIIEVVLDRSR
jgi:bifunctional ADP-heptose synthase (sugar kinase/adenylyltransferase)